MRRPPKILCHGTRSTSFRQVASALFSFALAVNPGKVYPDDGSPERTLASRLLHCLQFFQQLTHVAGLLLQRWGLLLQPNRSGAVCVIGMFHGSGVDWFHGSDAAGVVVVDSNWVTSASCCVTCASWALVCT
jgi:hypothetical protein